MQQYSDEKMNALVDAWRYEESIAAMRGWDFSHINNRYQEEHELPWDYRNVITQYLRPHHRILDMDTGGGEFLLSLGHPYANTSATEAWKPNIDLCAQKLLPLGIDFRGCSAKEAMPFADNSFDIILNRHGSYIPEEIYRMLRPGGLFITQQVGEANDRDLVLALLPDTPVPFPGMNMAVQSACFVDAGMTMLRAQEHFGTISFMDIGALVWFAHIIAWEFPGFSVDACLLKLLDLQKQIEHNGCVTGTTHRYLLVAQKPMEG